jgi:hypothetical protein
MLQMMDPLKIPKTSPNKLNNEFSNQRAVEYESVELDQKKHGGNKTKLPKMQSPTRYKANLSFDLSIRKMTRRI